MSISNNTSQLSFYINYLTHSLFLEDLIEKNGDYYYTKAIL